MAGLRRVLVHVRRGGAERPARVGQSVTGTFCPAHEDAAVVSCGLDRGRFLLSDVAFPGSTVALLERPSSCPAKHLGEPPAAGLPAELRGRGVAAAVAVLLQASTGHILLTRRAGALSTFPNVWVPPAAARGAAGAGGGDGAAPGSRDLLLEDARPLGVHLPAGAEPGAAASPPRHRLPAAALGRGPPPAGGQAAAQRQRGERLRLAGAVGPGGHRRRRGGSRGGGTRCHHCGRHRAEQRLLRHRPAPARPLPAPGRGAGQRRHQVRPSALAGGPGGSWAPPQQHPIKNFRSWSPMCVLEGDGGTPLGL
ncbi:nucleoside diphosphate-linked moiety X motif 17 isoform X1 [Strix aluco]|uniref:nucleoside diphosphate-linked moiety X motif 17 isoform X1 n=1 Tax=Strix aluco TaxID=111821 RepID=UPI003DA6C627